MSRIVIDCETTSLTKPFCYDTGYFIVDDKRNVLVRKHFVIEQVWHNLPLFESAYYKEKRPQYVNLMRQHKAIMTKWGYAMQEMKRDIKTYGVTDAYAYNSDFDDKVIAFNCDWFKCNNPLETIPMHDIWGYACQFITNQNKYKDFCEKYGFFTDTGNYKQSAEVVYRFLTGNVNFEEAHMGMHDVEIENEILNYCVDNGAKLGTDYTVNKILVRPKITPYTIKVNGAVIHSGNYIKKYIKNDTYNFTEF